MLKRILFHPGAECLGVSIGILILRVGTGLCMIIGHGWGKFAKLSESPVKFPDPLGLSPSVSLFAAIGTEVVAAAFIVIGLMTRWSAAALGFTMAVAAFMVHGDSDFDTKEKALLYLVPCVAFVFLGGGKLSLDKVISRRGSGDQAANAS